MNTKQIFEFRDARTDFDAAMLFVAREYPGREFDWINRDPLTFMFADDHHHEYRVIPMILNREPVSTWCVRRVKRNNRAVPSVV